MRTIAERKSSKHCSACGNIAAGNRPSQSVFQCENCGHEANTDMNAAENIRHLGLTDLAKAGDPPRCTAIGP